MAAHAVFRFMDLPPELRHRTYDFLDLVHPKPLCIYEVSTIPEVIQNAPKVMKEEMLDVYIGKNRFTISCLMGLPQLLATDAKPYISRIRLLRLTATETYIHGPPPSTYGHRCEVDVNLVRREPWFTTNLTCVGPGDQGNSNAVLTSFKAKLDAGLLNSKDVLRTLDADSLCDLAEHWLRCRILLHRAQSEALEIEFVP